jgi:hypothetical protein
MKLLTVVVIHWSRILEKSPATATQEVHNILWNLKVHYHTRGHHWSLSWIQSIQPHPISISSILILSTYIKVFLLAFPPKACMHSSSLHVCYMPSPHLLYLIILIIYGEGLMLWLSYYAVFSSLLLFHPFWIQIFSNTLACVFSLSETKAFTHTKLVAKLWFVCGNDEVVHRLN